MHIYTLHKGNRNLVYYIEIEFQHDNIYENDEVHTILLI